MQAIRTIGADTPEVPLDAPAVEPDRDSVTPSETAADVSTAARTRWSVRVTLTSLLVGLLGFGIGVMPTLWWHYQQNRAGERREAIALAGWLAANTTHALETSEQAGTAVHGVLQVPGVSEALVLSADGRVLAPASRAGEVMATLPGLQLPPSAILRTYDTHVGPEVQVAQPVQANGDPHAAIVWLAFTPGSVYEGPDAVLGSALLVACVLSLLVGWLASHRTQQAMARLNDGVQAMLAGRLEALVDPLGAPTIHDLAMTLTYLVTRLRATASGDLRRLRTTASWSEELTIPTPGTSVASTYAVAPSPVGADALAARFAADGAATNDSAAADEPGLDVRPDDACLVTNAELRIVRASPACEPLLGAPPKQLLGRHVLEAIPTGALATTVLRGLADVASIGDVEGRATFADGSGVCVVLHRAAVNAGIVLVLRPITSTSETPETMRKEGDVS